MSTGMVSAAGGSITTTASSNPSAPAPSSSSGNSGNSGVAANSNGAASSGTTGTTMPKRYGKIVLTLQNCLLPPETLERTPSQEDGLSASAEADLRALACELLQTAGILLRLPQVAMATGQVYLQRFYYSKSFVRYPMEIMAMGSIHLAAKVEEKPCRIRDVINVFHHIKQVRAQKAITPLILDPKYVELKNQVIKAERRILKELGFCVHVKHPHKLIVVYLQLLTYEKNKQLVQMSWNYMNDALRTDVFMRYQPETIACACIYLTARKIGLPLPNNPHWFSLFSVKEEDITDVCLKILKLYTRPKVNAEELERKIEDLKRIYQANKVINSVKVSPTVPPVNNKVAEPVKEKPETVTSVSHSTSSSKDEKREKTSSSTKSTTPPLKHHSRKYKHESRRSRSPYERKDRHKKQRSPSPRRNRSRTSKHHHRDRSRSKDRDDKRKY